MLQLTENADKKSIQWTSTEYEKETRLESIHLQDQGDNTIDFKKQKISLTSEWILAFPEGLCELSGFRRSVGEAGRDITKRMLISS
jgi:hypothetical protein